MGADAVVVVTPIGDEHLRFEQRGEAFAVQEFVSQLAVKRFDVAVFPGGAGLDKQRLDLQPTQPVFDGPGTELRTIVRAEVLGRPAADEEVAKRLEDLGGAEFTLDPDR